MVQRRVSGFTFIKNGLSLGYPIKESIMSIEPLCDEIIIIDRGRIISQGNPKTLLANHFDNSVITLPSSSLPEGFEPGEGASLLPQDNLVEILT